MLHLILTRYNLRLWHRTKRGGEAQTDAWLRHRADLFEAYCLPSLAAQTCKDFVWVLLLDAESPEWLQKRTEAWKQQVPQIRIIKVKPEASPYFAQIFKEVAAAIIKQKQAEQRAAVATKRLLTTYLDNDDALRCDFVEHLQSEASSVADKTFINYRWGLQYFTELGIATRVPYKYNHFNSYVEDFSEAGSVRTVFGMGSHTTIRKTQGTHQHHVVMSEHPMWVEVVHEQNKYNDVLMSLRTHLVTDPSYLPSHFGWHAPYIAAHPRRVFLLRFLPRAAREVLRHIRDNLFGFDWS